MVAQAGDLGVAGYVSQAAAVGTIGYVEYSYAIQAGFPVAKVLNAAGYYTEPTPGHVAVALLAGKDQHGQDQPGHLPDPGSVAGSTPTPTRARTSCRPTRT